MIFNIDTDTFLPAAVVILAITFTSCYQTLIPRSYLEPMERENMLVYSKLSEAYRENRVLAKELQSYRATAASLESLGASHTQAIQTIKASEVYSLDPKLLGSLIASESSYKQVHHAIPTVVGLCGINTACGSTLIYNPYSDAGNIMVAAKLLSDYKKIYHTDLLAVTRYKGYSALGYSQALHVMAIYYSIKD